MNIINNLDMNKKSKLLQILELLTLLSDFICSLNMNQSKSTDYQ